ncbi:cardiolipin synthase B [Marinobacterium nitratireducens]|uniref:Cardiolipin synthase B n=1 Tax=Marinobacterium nitratireducens TaxID=518897 RepID=A0A918DY24_9GAMM|nr:phospholipase D-like domain-containing protein [Marinobacterium nitratireducens]GGO87465.1 cardiolipin synthase B [Marinobacterium nitratireducens]
MQQHRRFKWRAGNAVELIVDGEQFFPVMLRAIREASHSVLMEFYLVSSGHIMDRFIDELIGAARRGVMVRLIIDGFGGRKLSDRDRRRLEAEGILILVYNPLKLNKLTRNFARDHRKLMIVDQQRAFIGGTGLTDEYWLSEHRGCPWHEVMLSLTGPVVADLLALYNGLWQRFTATRLPPGAAGPALGPALMKVTTTEGLYQQGIKLSFLQQVHRAEERVWLATAYFLPSRSVRRALRRAALRGVDVRLIVAGPYTDQPWVFHASKRHYQRLLKAGVRIFEYQPRFLHAKVGVVDDWSSVGSCNLDHWNLRWNLEANVEVKEPEFIGQVTRMLQADLEHCLEVTLARWSERPWHRRFLEYIWSWISQMVLRIR